MTEGREPTEMGADRSIGEKVKAKAHEAQERVSEAAGDLKDRGEDLVEEGKEMGRELADRAGEAARTRADQEKDRVAGGMRAVANALRRGSDDLPEDQRVYGRFLEGVADRVSDASRYLDERDVNALGRDVRRVAREHSAAFLGGAFVLGMVGARFLKSSPDDARGGREDQYGRNLQRGLPQPGMTGPGVTGSGIGDSAMAGPGTPRPPEQGFPEPRDLDDRDPGMGDPLEGGRDARGI
jgi:hypothetical protein